MTISSEGWLTFSIKKNILQGIFRKIIIIILLGFCRCIIFSFVLYQEYVPEHDEITSKLVWEGVDRLNYVPESGVAT